MRPDAQVPKWARKLRYSFTVRSQPQRYDTGMTPNDMRERAKDCYQRSDRARQAAGLAKDSSREWLLRMSDQWADMGRQYEATAAQQAHLSLPN